MKIKDESQANISIYKFAHPISLILFITILIIRLTLHHHHHRLSIYDILVMSTFKFEKLTQTKEKKNRNSLEVNLHFMSL